MATAVTTFPWLASASPWTPAAGTLNSHAWTTSYGNPSGCIGGLEQASGAGTTGVGTATYGPTWEDLSVPAGATVTNVEVTQLNTCAGLTDATGFGSAKWDVTVASSAAGWSAASLFTRTKTTTDSAVWQTAGCVAGGVAVPAGAQPSNTVLQLVVTLTCVRSTGTSKGVSGHYDQLQITVTYTPATVDRTATGGLKTQAPLLGGSATNTPPARTATGTLKPQLPLLVGTAANAPARSASGGLAAQMPLVGGAATNAPPARSAGGGLAAQLPLLAGTATNTAAAPRGAAGSLAAQLPLLGGAAANTPPARAAGGSLKLQLPLLAGAATNVPPARTGSGSLLVQLPLVTGTATNVPPARSASGGLQVQLPIFASTATVVSARIATGSLKTWAPLLGGTASVERRGDGGLTLSSPLLGGTAANVPPARAGAGGLTAQTPSLGGAATNVLAEPRTASGGMKLRLPIISGHVLGPNLDLIATLCAAGWQARLVAEGWSAETALEGWAAQLTREGWNTETAREGWRATVRKD